MKISLKELKKIIRETISDTDKKFVDPNIGSGVDVVSDEEFDAIILSENHKILENINVFSVSLASLIGLGGLGLVLGKAMNVAHDLYDSFDEMGKQIAIEKAKKLDAMGILPEVEQLANDELLEALLDELNLMRGSADAKSVKSQVKKINSHIRLKMLTLKKSSIAQHVKDSRQPRPY